MKRPDGASALMKALVSGELMGVHWSTMFFQISGRSHNHTVVVRKLANDKVEILRFADTNNDVQPLIYEACNAIGQHKIDGERRIKAGEITANRGDMFSSQRNRRAYPQQSLWFELSVPQHRLGLAYFGKDPQRAFEQFAAFIGKRESARAPYDQTGSRSPFECRETLAYHAKGKPH